MPLTDLQHRLLRILAQNRNPHSYIDLFSDRVEALANSVEADTRSLAGAGIAITWQARSDTFHRAVVSDNAETTRLDWAVDSDYRFFPTQRDARFGYALHPVDLATNKLLAAEGRNEVRDRGVPRPRAVHRSPSFPGKAFQADLDLRLERLDQARLRRGHGLAATGAGWLRVRAFPERPGRARCPDFAGTGGAGWRIHTGSRGGAWPSSSEISGEMLRDATRSTPRNRTD